MHSMRSKEEVSLDRFPRIIWLMSGRKRYDYFCIMSIGQRKTPHVRGHFSEHWHLVMCPKVNTGILLSPQGRDCTGERDTERRRGRERDRQRWM